MAVDIEFVYKSSLHAAFFQNHYSDINHASNQYVTQSSPSRIRLLGFPRNGLSCTWAH